VVDPFLVRRSWSFIVIVALAAPSCACSATTTSQAQPSTSAVTHLMVTVSPAMGLRNGQTVQVTVSGFPPGKAHLSECVSASEANPLGCGVQPAAQPFVVIENGGGTAPFTVTAQAPTGPLESGTSLCSTGCVLVATAGESSSGPGGWARVPISFAS
jgi:hypothetical protein